MSTVKLDNEVVTILEAATITDTLLVLPEGQLERTLYVKVAKAIQLAGGKWNRGKKGFIFTSDPRAKLGLAVSEGTIVDEKKARQAFYTPEAVADIVADYANVYGLDVLEPSAGGGALVRVCVDRGAKTVVCVEKEEGCREALLETGQVVSIADFMTLEPYRKFPRIVMNPPYTRGQYHKHVARAMQWLEPKGLLFAIVPDNQCNKLEALGAETVYQFEEGAFKESGTMVRTRLVVITKWS